MVESHGTFAVQIAAFETYMEKELNLCLLFVLLSSLSFEVVDFLYDA